MRLLRDRRDVTSTQYMKSSSVRNTIDRSLFPKLGIAENELCKLFFIGVDIQITHLGFTWTARYPFPLRFLMIAINLHNAQYSHKLVKYVKCKNYIKFYLPKAFPIEYRLSNNLEHSVIWLFKLCTLVI
jgi:hypothetical protein